MQTTIWQKTDISIMLEAGGVCLYIEDDETPSVSVSFEDLTDEFLECVCIDGKADIDFVDQVVELITSMETSLAKLKAAI
jgi:uroporphyrinogen-III decarboxylase